ncbi:hypothetical protein [Emticicia sp. BO119]|uniref:hypothetical protein n=1 Tax=Emticicia sp. BO119 TaxID=2757768 RepID=UPI0015F085CA|nr:hypothetical protein [Emticicia sp. BO119]MBA4849484.1 hypothetical protein [Emticicia sp. BO119]
MNDIDKIYEIVQDSKNGKLKLPEITISLDNQTIGLIVAGVGGLFGLMFLGVYWLIKSTLKK